MKQATTTLLLAVGGASLSLGLLLGALFTKRRKRVSGDGLSSSTDDLSLYYASDVDKLTAVTDELKKLPADLYGKAVKLLPICCIDLAIERPSDGRFLLVKRATEPVKGFWWVPGGRIFRNETFYAAAKRKAKEETGVETEALAVLGVWNTFFPTSAWGGSTHTINVAVHLRLKSQGR